MTARFFPALAIVVAFFTSFLAATAKAAGTLIIIGGGLGPDTDAVWRRIITESGPNPLIFVIAAASSEPEESGAWAVEQLRRRGARAEIVPLAQAGEAFGGRAAGAAQNPDLAAQARAANGFYFTGGAQARIVDLLAPSGVATPLLKAIQTAHAGGATIAGTSAGAAIMSRSMFRDPRPQEEILATGPIGEDLGRGLGFLDGPFLVDQHFLARGRHLRMFSALCADPSLRAGLGVDEATALVVRNGEARIVGDSAVALLRIEERQSCAPLSVRGRFSILRPGDVLRLATFEVGAAPDVGAAPSPAQDVSALPGLGGLARSAAPAAARVQLGADAQTRTWGLGAETRVLDGLIWVDATKRDAPAAE